MKTIEEKTKIIHSPNAFYVMEFNQSGIMYLDCFILAKSIFFGEIFQTDSRGHKDKRINFNKEIHGSWN